MLRRLLIGNGKRLIDDNTVFFNDGKSFTDKVGNGKISTVGDISIGDHCGETCLKINGVNQLSCVVIGNNKKFYIKNGGVKTFECELCMDSNADTFEILSYGDGVRKNTNTYYSVIGHANYTPGSINFDLFVIDYYVQGNSTWITAPRTFSIPKSTWFHMAIETDNTTAGRLEINFYINEKYLGTANIPIHQNNNAENLMQNYIGSFGETPDSLYAPIKTGGVKNIRISNILRYKKKDYTPYVDN